MMSSRSLRTMGLRKSRGMQMTALWWNCRRTIAGLDYDQQGNRYRCAVAYPRQNSSGRVMVALVDVEGSKKESKRRGLE